MQNHHLTTPDVVQENSRVIAPITFHTSKNPNAKGATWKAHEQPWWGLVDYLKAEAAIVADRQPGPAIVPAAFVGDLPKKAAVSSIGALVVEVEGVALWTLQDRVAEQGWSACAVNTWANGRTQSTLPRDGVLRWLDKNGRPDFGGKEINAASLGFYTGEVLGWHETADSVTVTVDNGQDPTGSVIVIGHDPLPAFLVVLPLAPAFEPAANPAGHDAGIRMWAEVHKTAEYALTGCNALPKASRDPAATIVMPRTHPTAEPEFILIDGEPMDWRDLGIEEAAPVAVAAKPTFESIKAAIKAMPPKAETPDPTPVLEMIARIDNGTHRETLLQSLKASTGVSVVALRGDVRDRRRAAGDGPEEGWKVDKATGYRTFVFVGEPDHRLARAGLLTTMEKANNAADEPIFCLNMGQVMGLRRHGERASFEALTSRQFQAALFKHCSFAAHRDGGDLTQRAPDADICGILMDGLEPGELPQQPMIRRAPTVARDGRILDHDGWFGDVLVDLGDLTPPVVPMTPTADEIANARDLILDEVLGDFPFDDDGTGAEAKGDASRANTVGMLLTPFARDLFDGPSPVFAIVKPSPGVGGTLLAETVQRVFDGYASATTPNSRNEEEMQKILLASALGDDSFMFFDNVTDFNSETLKRSTTADRIGGRILGQSKTISRPNHFTWIVTGINPRLGPEMSRRSVFINLNSRVEDNAGRNYRHEDFKGWLNKSRSRIIGALLTLIRAWWAAGHEPGKAKLASFESWSGVIGGILETAGIEGFLSNPRKASADREGAEIKAFMRDWWAKFGSADTLESTAYDYAVTVESSVITGFPDGRRAKFGEMLDGLRGRPFDLDDNRVIFGEGDKEGWRLVHLGQVAKPEKAHDAYRP